MEGHGNCEQAPQGQLGSTLREIQCAVEVPSLRLKLCQQAFGLAMRSQSLARPAKGRTTQMQEVLTAVGTTSVQQAKLALRQRGGAKLAFRSLAAKQGEESGSAPGHHSSIRGGTGYEGGRQWW